MRGIDRGVFSLVAGVDFIPVFRSANFEPRGQELTVIDIRLV